MRFCLGRFSFELDAPSEFDSILPVVLKQYSESNEWSVAQYSIHLRKAEPEENRCLEDGWKPDKRNELPTVTYAANGQPIFSISQYDAKNELTVFVPYIDARSVRLGLQFACLLALHKHCVGLHGVTLLCGDEIIILSAPSGTGKTTLSGLLELYCDALVINGDFALLSVDEEGVIFEPTPFCGTSGRCLNHRVRIQRIVFLEQGLKNQWRNLTARQALPLLLSNTFIPNWDHIMSSKVQSHLLQIASLVRVNAFSFYPEREAAEMFYQQITHETDVS